MIEEVTLITADRFPGALAAQHRLRYRIFCERLGWDLPAFQEMEYDQFDTPAATYLVWRDDDGEAHGVARLVPTTQPYMLQQLWPDLLGTELVSAPDVWEGTRFGVDHSLPAFLRAQVSAELVLGCLEFARVRSIRRYIVMMPVFVIKRVIGGAGCRYRFLARSGDFGRVEVGVAEITVDTATLAEARRRLDIHSPVLFPDQEKKEPMT